MAGSGPSAPVDDAGQGRQLGRNFLRLLKGRAASALLLFAATVLMARSLSPADFGLVVLIHSYLLVLRGLVNLKPFEAIIHFGVPLLERGDVDRLMQLLRLTFALDVALAVLGAGLAALFAFALGEALAWNEETRQLAALYCLLLLASPSGSASGVLRLFNRFDLLGLRQAMGPLAQLTGVVLAWWMQGDYGHFLLASGVAFIVEHAVLMVFGYRELRRQHPAFRWRGELLAHHRQRFPGLWRFLHIVYWQSNIDLVPKQVSLLLVGALLGSAAAGMFRIGQQVARLVSVPALLLRQVLFPDLARLWFRRDPAFRQLLWRTLLIALLVGAAVALLSLVVGEPVMTALAGEGYAGVADVLSWLLLAAGLELAVAALRAAGYAMGAAAALLRASILATVSYLVALTLLGGALGLQGVAFAVVVGAVIHLLAFSAIVLRHLKHAVMSHPD